MNAILKKIKERFAVPAAVGGTNELLALVDSLDTEISLLEMANQNRVRALAELEEYRRRFGGPSTHRHRARGTRYFRSPLFGLDSTNAHGDTPVTLYFPMQPAIYEPTGQQIDFFVRNTKEFDDGRFLRLVEMDIRALPTEPKS